MHVHPAIAALRGHQAPQRRVDTALARWRASPAAAAALEALAAYGAGAPLADLPALARLVRTPAAARDFAGDFIAPLVAALRAEPLAQLPLGYSAALGLARIRLAEHGRATLRLTVFAPTPQSATSSALLEDCEAHEIVLAGAGRAALYRRTRLGLASDEIECRPGTCINRNGAADARRITAVTRPLLVLQLTREAVHPEPSREYALPGGALLKSISACKRTSQQMMALGVLGALAHRPALDAIERLALDEAAMRDLRWEALRQLLGLDTARGVALLARLVARPDDSLGDPAAKLHRDLVAAHPGLAVLEPA
ncbi:hypothetical protein [Erythrobacter sp.]|uniref:hypothetical protein n=1 Tax=Erythrobacter sp. TaxID=1042 RepID=UPI0025DDBB3F|nr:hypothetical protein [Erythrobacter sp.]